LATNGSPGVMKVGIGNCQSIFRERGPKSGVHLRIYSLR
jgi:hypothetical protein